MKRIKPYEVFPERWWFFVIVEQDDGREFYLAQLRLPSYKFDFCFYERAYRWMQLAIFWHGNEGFSKRWLPCRDSTE